MLSVEPLYINKRHYKKKVRIQFEYGSVDKNHGATQLEVPLILSVDW